MRLLPLLIVIALNASCQKKDGYAVIEIKSENTCHGEPCSDPKEWSLYYDYNTWIYSNSGIRIDNIYNGYTIAEATTFDKQKSEMIKHAIDIMKKRKKKWDVYFKDLNTGVKTKIKTN